MKKWTNECSPVFYRPSSSSGSLPKNANFGLLWSFLRHFRPFFWVTVGSRRFGQGQQHTWGSSTFSYPMIFIQVQFRALDVVGGHNDGNEWWKWASLGYKRYGPFCGSAIGKSEFCSNPVTPLWYCLIASLRCKIVGAHRELGKLWDHAKKSVMKLYNLINKRKEWKISVTNWEQNLNFAVRGTAKCTLYFQAIFFCFCADYAVNTLNKTFHQVRSWMPCVVVSILAIKLFTLRHDFAQSFVMRSSEA